jgi:hypothetical protein
MGDRDASSHCLMEASLLLADWPCGKPRGRGQSLVSSVRTPGFMLVPLEALISIIRVPYILGGVDYTFNITLRTLYIR